MIKSIVVIIFTLTLVHGIPFQFFPRASEDSGEHEAAAAPSDSLESSLGDLEALVENDKAEEIGAAIVPAEDTVESAPEAANIEPSASVEVADGAGSPASAESAESAVEDPETVAEGASITSDETPASSDDASDFSEYLKMFDELVAAADEPAEMDPSGAGFGFSDDSLSYVGLSAKIDELGSLFEDDSS